MTISKTVTRVTASIYMEAYVMVLSMNNRKFVFALAGMALVLVGALYLAPALARPYWLQSAEDGEAAPVPPYGHCYVNGTWVQGGNETLQPPCWDPETGEYVPKYNGTRPDWCPYAGGQAGQGTGGLGGFGGMMRNWANGAQQALGGRGGMMRGLGGGCGRTG